MASNAEWVMVAVFFHERVADFFTRDAEEISVVIALSDAHMISTGIEAWLELVETARQPRGKPVNRCTWSGTAPGRATTAEPCLALPYNLSAIRMDDLCVGSTTTWRGSVCAAAALFSSRHRSHRSRLPASPLLIARAVLQEGGVGDEGCVQFPGKGAKHPVGLQLHRSPCRRHGQIKHSRQAAQMRDWKPHQKVGQEVHGQDR